MKELNERSLKTLALLSIVVPVSLLASLRLTGILSEPPGQVSETITLEVVKWECERPYEYIRIDENVSGFYRQEINSLQGISIPSYGFFGHGSDSLDFKVNVTASLQIGFVHGVKITFKEDYETSQVAFFEVNAWPEFYSHVENLSIVNYAHHLQGSGLKAFMELTSESKPKSVHFDGTIYWMLYSPENRTHLLEITTELVYYNGTAFKKVVQPFQLKIASDNNDSFETAQEIHEGYYPRFYIGGLPDVGIGDIKDYYKIYAAQGQRIRVYVNGRAWSKPKYNGTHYVRPIFNETTWSWSWQIVGETWDESWPGQVAAPYFDLCLYDPERNLVISSERENYIQSIDFVVNSTGFWFVEIRLTGSHGWYGLGVNQ